MASWCCGPGKAPSLLEPLFVAASAKGNESPSRLPHSTVGSPGAQWEDTPSTFTSLCRLTLGGRGVTVKGAVEGQTQLGTLAGVTLFPLCLHFPSLGLLSRALDLNPLEVSKAKDGPSYFKSQTY